MSYSDDVLRQYLDGALDDARTKEIETAMLSDADLEARLMALDDLAGEVKAAMMGLPSDQRLAGLAPTVTLASAPRRSTSRICGT